MARIAYRKAGYIRICRIRGHDYIRGYDHMHHKLMRASARTAVIGAVVVLGSAAAAQGAMAGSAPSGIVSVACNTPALISAFASASNGEKLQLSFGCTYRLTKPLPHIDTNTTIVGMGATLERSQAPGTRRFTILTVGKDADVNFVEVNFRNGGGIGDGDGVVADDDVNDYGGAIYNDGANITVLGGTFTGNDSAYGGAIANYSGTLTMTSAYFIDNYGNSGGAIYNEDTMTLRSTHFLGSEAAYGGAIYNDGDATVIGTTFTEDGAGIYGGALDNEYHATLSYVTIQDNYTQDGYGGGIYNNDTLAVDHSNIVHNSASYGGGGIFNDIDGTVTLSLTKVSGNTPGNCFPIGTIAGCSG
jgi:predicted outer membrane repeat protein